MPKGDGTFSGKVAGTDPQQKTDLQFAQMANDVYDIPDPKTGKTETKSEAELKEAGWNRLQVPPGDNPDHLVDAQGNRINIDPKMLEDSKSGFRAAIYQNAEGQYVVAYAGTDPKEMGDLRADAGQAFGLETKQYNQAMALAKEATDEFGKGNVAFAGHSLGGGLASFAALSVNASAVTFNAAGVSNDSLRSLGMNPNAVRDQLADSGQVRRYVVNTDPLTLAQQDLPLIPILPIGSPPNAVGHELRLTPPPGTTPVVGTHGGSGDDGDVYVEAVRTQTPYEPKEHGLVFNTVQNAGEMIFNQWGNVAQNVRSNITDTVTTVKDTAGEIKDTVQSNYSEGRYVDGTVSVVGDVADGTLNLAGKTVSNGLSLTGDTVQNITDGGGQLIRDLGKGSLLETPANFVAGLVEGTGNLFAKGTDGLGKGIEWLTDKGGDVVEWGVDRIADGAQGLYDGAKWTGGKIVEGVSWTGNKISEGASWVGDKVSKAMPWNW
ncbi:Mbeg1-like protein [Luteimonas aquatica]|uniref:Mbeg1-like protein n=1 Tax=Luteimonas aquatica TaxID=450364 RepID=UPI001F59698B|nr:Mbeg1-like protein [Luteimonas aquatica]